MTPAMLLRINEVFAQLTEGATPSDSNIVYVSLRHGYLVGHADAAEPAETVKTIVTELDDDDPLWLVNEQIKGLLEGVGADEDHQDVLTFLRATGLPEDTVTRMHKALVCAEVKATPDVYVEHQLFMDKTSRIISEALPVGTGLKVLK